MRRERLEDWARQSFIKLLGQDGDGIWSEAEELIKRKRLIEFTPQEGRITARFSGDKPIRCQLIVPILAESKKVALYGAVKFSTLYSAIVLADKLPWNAPEFESLITADSFIPVNLSTSTSAGVDNKPSIERFNQFTTAVYIELIRRFESDTGLFFTIRGLGREELIAVIRDRRSELWRGVEQKSLHHDLEPSQENSERANPELFNLTYQLRADELPALLFKKVEGIPLDEGADIVDSVLTELYAHIAKRAQAYGLSIAKP